MGTRVKDTYLSAKKCPETQRQLFIYLRAARRRMFHLTIPSIDE